MTHVRYHNTIVVSFDHRTIILRTGGYYTAATKKRMNQTSETFALGFNVIQRDHEWRVEYQGGVYTFWKDGYNDTLTFDRESGECLTTSQCPVCKKVFHQPKDEIAITGIAHCTDCDEDCRLI